MDEQQFIACADAALYQAKQQGRNQIVVYENS
jgi:PleD family two-component response regulator